jgi:hypothetical protein
LHNILSVDAILAQVLKKGAFNLQVSFLCHTSFDATRRAAMIGERTLHEEHALKSLGQIIRTIPRCIAFLEVKIVGFMCSLLPNSVEHLWTPCWQAASSCTELDS